MQRWFWGVAVLAGIAIGVIAAMLGSIPHQTACDGDTGLAAILRFELVISPADVAALFGTGECMVRLTAAMDAVNRIDSMAFIPAFTAFQAAAALALRGQLVERTGSRLLALAVVNVALIAGGLDMMENFRLFAIGWTVRADSPVLPAAIDPLFWIVRGKFVLLALAAIGLGVLVSRLGGRAAIAAGMTIVSGGICASVGLVEHALLTPGIALAWVTVWLVALMQTFRAGRSPVTGVTAG